MQDFLKFLLMNMSKTVVFSVTAIAQVCGVNMRALQGRISS